MYRKQLFSFNIFSLTDNYCREWTSITETKELWGWVLRQFRRRKSFAITINNVLSEIILATDKFLNKLRLEVPVLSNRELNQIFLELFLLGNRQYGLTILSEGSDILAEKDYLRHLKAVPPINQAGAIRLLTTPGDLTAIERERLGLWRLAQEAGQNQLIKKILLARDWPALRQNHFFTKLESHAQVFCWVQNGFESATNLDWRYFVMQLREILDTKTELEIQKTIKRLADKSSLIKKKQRQLISKYQLSLETQSFFSLISWLAILQDKRKEQVQKAIAALDFIWVEIERRLKVPRAQLYKYLVPEITALLLRGRRVKITELKARRQIICFSYLKNGQIKTDYVVGHEAIAINNHFLEKRKFAITDKKLRGFVASVGRNQKKVSGKVRLVFNPARDTFRTGEILVTGMTRPEFVPLMKRALAIITNEGGVTSHAAIVARELGIPCIIGTRHATEVLKSGDKIELDLREGTVRLNLSIAK
ncbi:MAG TPA: hypothetical protein DDX47_03750 [Candidatus Jacksonbacteria bacterium]|nr:hypothetical protein [Candidatus Jacksonbacteria bacterium]HCC50349.1 hypothetical protein [Candidatus Jacksonbacteria bacterium]HCE49633.1 hypothetical protein [Candidatus Jacksonbacteria bacterium]HCR15339.1 hypothetical protein [Candidatus Jacksonbacteria bacterium]